jgi:hypothetical protein
VKGVERPAETPNDLVVPAPVRAPYQALLRLTRDRVP